MLLNSPGIWALVCVSVVRVQRLPSRHLPTLKQCSAADLMGSQGPESILRHHTACSSTQSLVEKVSVSRPWFCRRCFLRSPAIAQLASFTSVMLSAQQKLVIRALFDGLCKAGTHSDLSMQGSKFVVGAGLVQIIIKRCCLLMTSPDLGTLHLHMPYCAQPATN